MNGGDISGGDTSTARYTARGTSAHGVVWLHLGRWSKLEWGRATHYGQWWRCMARLGCVCVTQQQQHGSGVLVQECGVRMMMMHTPLALRYGLRQLLMMMHLYVCGVGALCVCVRWQCRDHKEQRLHAFIKSESTSWGGHPLSRAGKCVCVWVIEIVCPSRLTERAAGLLIINLLWVWERERAKERVRERRLHQAGQCVFGERSWLELWCHRLTHCLPSKHTVGRGKNAGLDLLVCVCACVM